MKQQRKTSGAGLASWLTGAALGAAAMYFSDPRQGRRRRALLRDKLTSMSLSTLDARDATMRDLGNRMEGMRAKFWRMVEGRGKAPDDQALVAHLRTLLGRLVSHPHAIAVTADGGRVTLSGAILADERELLLAQAYKMPGVTEIEDRLSVYASPTGVPALQGRHRVARQAGWQPTLQALAGAGGMLGAYGLMRRNRSGLLLAGAGLAVLGRAISSLRHAGSQQQQQQQQEQQQQAVTRHLERSIEVNAAPETVFDAWSDFENFPHFFRKLLAVHNVDNDRSHWVMQETADSRVEWNAAWSRRERPRLLAWRSEENAAFGLAGTVMFEPIRQGTRVRLQLTMPAPQDATGAMTNRRLVEDLKRELGEDLIRMKSFIESGVVPHHATGSTRPEGGQLLH